MEKRTVNLEIAGARYRMTSDADADHLLQLASVVNERIEKLGDRAARQASPAQLLAVVALGLADDLLGAQQRVRKIEDLTRSTVQRAIERIDARLESHAEEDASHSL